MCGRFSLDTTKAEIAKEFKCDRVAYKGSSFNIAPSQNITTVVNTGNNNEAVIMRWGLIPRWVKSLDSWKSNLINARVETADEKPSFKDAFKKRPCLIPVTGFYEWSKDKQPYYFHTQSKLFSLAGIYESWQGAESEILSCTILTTKAQNAVAQIHHRMPVIISAEYYDLWLSNLDGAEYANRQAPITAHSQSEETSEGSPIELNSGEPVGRKELVNSLSKLELQLYPVSKKVNSPKNNSPDCIKSIE